MEVIYTPQAVEDLKYWKKSGNKKYELSGSWSRRINSEHRIIYEVYENNTIIILEVQSLRGHYLK